MSEPITSLTITETESASAEIPEKALRHAENAGLSLVMTETGLALTDGVLYLCADLSKNLRRLQTNNLRQELLVKAARIKGTDLPLKAVDATAGFGEDSLLLAAAGFTVDLYEYDPVIAALLEDALRRAAAVPELAETVSRMHLHKEDSISALLCLSEAAQKPDVVLLDPMFPTREKSGLIKKKFQLLQRLEQPCADEQELLAAAFAAHPHKIVIKRPLKGPFLAERKPDYSLPGKAIRYDCFVLV